VFHVAGTNGKGSTCAYLRAMLEAQGLTVHSPPSRIWCAITNGSAGGQIDRGRPAGRASGRVLDANDAGEDLGPSFSK
jgi:dihydrofolate synthase/folylpolyglutamate synthase